MSQSEENRDRRSNIFIYYVTPKIISTMRFVEHQSWPTTTSLLAVTLLLPVNPFRNLHVGGGN